MFRRGDQVGPYYLLEKIGRGGFGVVWLAEQRNKLAAPKVALKLPNDVDVDLEAVRQEAELWVQVSGHPNVLSIVEADIYDGQVVIVSEYAPDGSLGDWLIKHGGKAPNLKAALQMADGILAGLEHLHARRIIHRDLKPANILLQGEVPCLVDFGLARILKSSSHSHTTSGTYAYMPPETFAGDRSEQTDVWSAGVVLYQMLTGELPYPTNNDAVLIAAILNQPPKPLPADVPPALRAVVEKALQKDLAARFASAMEMRQALRAVSDNIRVVNEMPTVKDLPAPVIAPISSPTAETETGPQAEPVTEPNPRAVVTEVLPFVASELVKPVPTVPVAPATTNPAPVAALFTQSLAPKRAALWLGAGILVLFLFTGGLWLFSFKTGSGSAETTKSKRPVVNSTNPSKPVSFQPFSAWTTPNEVFAAAVSADGSTAVSVGGETNRNISVWRNGNPTPTVFKGHTSAVRSVALSPDGQTIASGSDDNTVRLWRLSDGVLQNKLEEHRDAVFLVAYSRDGQTLGSSGYDKTVRWWRVSDGSLLKTLDFPDAKTQLVNFSPDLQRVAFYQPQERIARVWSVADNKEVSQLQGVTFVVSGGEFAPDGQTLALGSQDGEVRIFRAKNGQLLQTLHGAKGQTYVVTFSPDGQFVAAGYPNGSIALWRVADGQLLQTLNAHEKSVNALAFSGDGRTLVSGGADKKLRLWQPAN